MLFLINWVLAALTTKSGSIDLLKNIIEYDDESCIRSTVARSIILLTELKKNQDFLGYEDFGSTEEERNIFKSVIEKKFNEFKELQALINTNPFDRQKCADRYEVLISGLKDVLDQDKLDRAIKQIDEVLLVDNISDFGILDD